MFFFKGIPRLLYNIPFRRYWTGQTISLLGNQFTSLALPLIAVLVLHASAGAMGILTAAGWIPYLLLGIHAGVWVDHWGRRRQIMIAADIIRALLLISIPISYLLGYLSLPELLITAFSIGICTVFFNVSSSTLFVSLVSRDRYVEANSLLNGSRAVSSQVGPGLGGLLIQFLSAPIILIADALSFLISAFFLARVHTEEPPPVQAKAGHISTGLRFIWATPILRILLASVATINFFSYIFSALFILYVTRVLQVPPSLLGLILSCGAFGSVLGSFVTNKISRRIGLGCTALLGSILFPLPMILVPLAGGPHILVLLLLFLTELFSGLGVMILDISYGSIKAAVIPDDIRARVNGAWGSINNGIRPLGALIGGALPTFLGIHGSLWVGTIGASLGFLWLIPSRIVRLHDLKDFVTPKTETGTGYKN